SKVTEAPMMVERDWDMELANKEAHVVNRHTGERRAITDSRVKLIWPSMGRLATEMTASAARGYGIDSVALPPADVHTAARARAVASGKECIPALLVLGAFLEFFAKEPVDQDRVYLLFMPLTTGPCRTGQYAIFYQNLFQELGYRNVVVLSLNSDNSYAEIGGDINKRIWVALTLADYMRDIEGALRALSADWPKAQRVLEGIEKEMVVEAGRGSKELFDHLPGWAKRLGEVPLKKPLAEARRVLIVGEIFVRRDDYSVDTLINQLAEREIVTKITSLSEWIYYLDWDQARRFRKKLAAMPKRKRLFAKETRQLAWLGIELLWKHHQDKRIVEALTPTGLLTTSPHGMKRIMGRADEFASAELESEAALSPCVATVGMEEGYDGVAIIAPFACLPGRLIEALYAPWARARGWPVLALENDGNPYPPNVVSRIEIFAHNVGRGVRGDEPRAGKGFALKLGKFDWGHLQVPQELPKMPHLRSWARGFKYLPRAEEQWAAQGSEPATPNPKPPGTVKTPAVTGTSSWPPTR
ncbi:MAG: hypothetical protein ACYC8T_37785, partial [Myxococcaceae bacterium]